MAPSLAASSPPPLCFVGGFGVIGILTVGFVSTIDSDTKPFLTENSRHDNTPIKKYDRYLILGCAWQAVLVSGVNSFDCHHGIQNRISTVKAFKSSV